MEEDRTTLADEDIETSTRSGSEWELADADDQDSDADDTDQDADTDDPS